MRTLAARQRNKLESAAARLAAVDRLLITSHVGPDGDSVGSMIALASLLRSQGKRVTLYNADPVPRRLQWLPLTKTWVTRLRRDARYQLTIIVDCADVKLLGDSFPGPEVTGDLVVLDHHANAHPWGDIYVCDPEAASVGVLVARLARHNGWSLTREAALGIFVSLCADTGTFRYANTNAEAFELAAKLIDGGIDPWSVSEKLYEQVPLSRYRLLAAALGTLQPVLDGAVAFLTVTDDMLREARASWEDTDGLANYARALQGVECGVLITPAKRGGVRISMRSRGRRINAGAVCAGLGGGGHAGAAGCTIPGDLSSARARVEALLAAALAKARKKTPS